MQGVVKVLSPAAFVVFTSERQIVHSLISSISSISGKNRWNRSHGLLSAWSYKTLDQKVAGWRPARISNVEMCFSKSVVHRKHPQDTQDAFHNMVAARTQLVKQPEHRIFRLDPGSGSPMHEDLRVLLQRWNVLTKFRITRRQHDQLCARDRLSRDMALVDEFTGYWQKRQMANVWRTARQLSGKALGPKRRRFDVPLCSQPSKHDWEHFFSQDGPSGGCSALPCNMESRLSVETPSLEPAVKVLSDSAAFSLATGDFQRLERSLWKQQLRKAVPPWSLPVEIWRLLLFPAWYLRRPRFGIGASSLVPSTPKLHALLLELLTDVRAYNQAPLAWQTSLGHKINKGNQKEGCAGLRVVNCLDPIGKAYYTQLWKRGDRQSQPHYASGYCSRKSRIDAMVQQHVVGYRLRKNRKSYGKCFLDVANAFYSPYHTCLDSAVARVAHAEDLDLVQQRYKKAAVCIQASDAWACVCPRTGALQGDTSASDMFLEVYHPQIDIWNAAMPQISVQDPISNFIVDVSLATYADDVSKVLECHGADDLVHKVVFLNDQFDDALQTVGMAQNHDKQEHVPFFAGQGAHQHYKHVLEHQNALPGKCGRSARYLGGRQHHLDNAEEELEARHRAARVSWATFGKLWSRSGLPRRALCIIFAGTVVSALLSGLEALVLSSAQLRRLDSIILTYGRKLMRGAACKKEVLDGAIKFKACTSRQVWEYLRLVPCEIELRIRRLGWLQQLVRSPVLHCNVLAALFGKFPSDSETVPSFSINTNPWAQQLHNDVQTLGELDSGVCFLPFLQSDLSKLFSEFKTDFLYVDVSEFRAKYFSISIPPPGWVPEADLEPPDVEPVDDNLPYECECLLDDGTICGRKFATLQQLATHVRRFKAGNHGAIPQHYRAVVTNQCPWCMSTNSLLAQVAHLFNMESWARGKRADNTAVKRQAVGTEALLAKATLLISKLTLKNELEVRELQAAVFRTLTMSDSSDFIVRAREATKQYVDESKAAREQGNPVPKGEMHVYAWEALTRVAMETADAPAEAVEVIKVHRQSAADPELLSAQIYVCKVKKAYDRGVVKLHLAGHPDLGKVIDAVIAVLISTGAKERKGQAPQSGMARELQQLVEQLSAVVG
eukprot:symbB.v1.2.028194.t1/scaffold2897.1/size67685/5